MTGAEQQGPHNEVIKDVSKGPEAGDTVNMTQEQFDARIAQLEGQLNELKDQRAANIAKHLKEIGNDDSTDPQTPADAEALRDQISGFSAESEEVINSAKEELAKLAGEPKESTTEISADMLAAVKTAIAESYYEKYYEKQTTTPQTPETRAAWIQNYENLLKDASLESLKTQPGFAEVIDGYLKDKSPKAGEEASAPEASEPEPTPQPVAEVPKVPKEPGEPKESTTEVSSDMLASIKTAIAESYYEKYYEKQTTTPQTPETRAAWIKNYENLLKDASLESLKTQPGFAEVIDGYLKEKTPKAGEEASAPEASEPEPTPQPVAEVPDEPEGLEEAEERGENGDIPDGREQTPTAATGGEATAPKAAKVAPPPSETPPPQPVPNPEVFATSAKPTFEMGNIATPKTPDVPLAPREAQKVPEKQLETSVIVRESARISKSLEKTKELDSVQTEQLVKEVNNLFDQSLKTDAVLTQFELIDSMNAIKQPSLAKDMLSKLETKVLTDDSLAPQKITSFSKIAKRYADINKVPEAKLALSKAMEQNKTMKNNDITTNNYYRAAEHAINMRQRIEDAKSSNK